MSRNLARQYCWRFATALLCLVASTQLMAAELTAAVNKTTVAKNEVFELVITTDQSASQEDIDFSVLKDDFFMGQPSVYQDKRYANGQWRSQMQWRLSLAPIRLGNLTIPSFSVNGLSTQPISIEVSANPSEPKPEDIVQFDTQLDNATVYPQQSVVLTSKTIITADTRRLDNVRLLAPSAGNLSLEPLDKAKQYSAIVNGLQATVIEQQYRLTPTQPGDYPITTAGLNALLTFGDSLTRSTGVLPLEAKGEPITLTVLPIPANANQPWLPANMLTLGQTWLPEQASEQGSIAQGEAITREIHLAVSGIDPRQIAEPTVDYPESVRVYREKPQIVSLPNGQSQITYKHTVIPSNAGKLTLPQVDIHWWNARLARNETATVPSKTFEVTMADSALLPNMTPAEVLNAAPPMSNAQPWIVATGCFALLWLITLMWLIIEKRRPKPVAIQTDTQTDPLNLDAALKSGDAFTILRAVNRWLVQHPTDTTTQSAIQAELSAMQQAQFAQTAQPWDSARLEKLLKNAAKQPMAKQGNGLPTL